MTSEELRKEIVENLRDADKATGENSEYIRGWKSAMLTVLNFISGRDEYKTEHHT